MSILRKPFQFNNQQTEGLDYVCSLTVRGTDINVYLDDYGQCYCLEYLDKHGDIQYLGCGTYNLNFIDDAISLFDPKGYNYSVYGKEFWDKTLEFRKKRGLESIDYDDYEIYNIEEMYKELENER